ncbi:MAG TPA: hypothetical protein VN837_05765 [Chloroflexota bacterium]|nr:hypothetical protein [Chloroflexota bacterium]
MLSITAMPVIFGWLSTPAIPAMFDPVYRQLYSVPWQSENCRPSHQGYMQEFSFLH